PLRPRHAAPPQRRPDREPLDPTTDAAYTATQTAAASSTAATATAWEIVSRNPATRAPTTTSTSWAPATATTASHGGHRRGTISSGLATPPRSLRPTG